MGKNCREQVDGGRTGPAGNNVENGNAHINLCSGETFNCVRTGKGRRNIAPKDKRFLGGGMGPRSRKGGIAKEWTRKK